VDYKQCCQTYSLLQEEESLSFMVSITSTHESFQSHDLFVRFRILVYGIFLRSKPSLQNVILFSIRIFCLNQQFSKFKYPYCIDYILVYCTLYPFIHTITVHTMHRTHIQSDDVAASMARLTQSRFRYSRRIQESDANLKIEPQNEKVPPSHGDSHLLSTILC
jgi:hypothetical protein